MLALTARCISRLIGDFRRVQMGLGLIGNLLFFVGGACFLYQGLIKDIGVWLFMVGSFGMLIGSLDKAAVRYERHRLSI